MANIAGKRLLYGTAISPAARNRTRLLAIPGRLSQCLRRAVRFWLTAAPARVGAAGRRSPCSGLLCRDYKGKEADRLVTRIGPRRGRPRNWAVEDQRRGAQGHRRLAGGG